MQQLASLLQELNYVSYGITQSKCHLAEVTFPLLFQPAKASTVLKLATQKGCKVELA